MVSYDKKDDDISTDFGDQGQAHVSEDIEKAQDWVQEKEKVDTFNYGHDSKLILETSYTSDYIGKILDMEPLMPSPRRDQLVFCYQLCHTGDNNTSLPDNKDSYILTCFPSQNASGK